MAQQRRGTTIEQQALYGDSVIFWFDGFEGDQPFEYLSNFYVGEPIAEPGSEYVWMTGEHMFAAYKARSRRDFERVLHAADPGEAKGIGRSIALRADWESVKYDVMRWVLACKFTLARAEGQWLLETGDRLLVEGTWWGDRVWGVDMHRAPAAAPWQGPGRNWLGALLMARRAELRAERDLGATFMYPTTMLYARKGNLA